jgi:hypothetical protein
MTDFLDVAPLYRVGDLRLSKDVLPGERGVYGLFFGRAPGPAPMAGCLVRAGRALLYIGTAGADLNKNGTLRNRLGDHHLGGNERRSTVCNTLAALMPEVAGPAVARIERGRVKYHTSAEGVVRLRRWMDENIAACWVAAPRPADLEMGLVQRYRTPLNIEFSAHPFLVEVQALRSKRREVGV